MLWNLLTSSMLVMKYALRCILHLGPIPDSDMKLSWLARHLKVFSILISFFYNVLCLCDLHVYSMYRVHVQILLFKTIHEHISSYWIASMFSHVHLSKPFSDPLLWSCRTSVFLKELCSDFFQIQLTLEQHGFELSRSTNIWIFKNNTCTL